MDGIDAGVVDAPEIDLGAEEVETELVEEGAAEVESAEPATLDPKDDPYTTRFSREMRAALKAWEQNNPEAARFAKQARDNHARMFALQQLEPRGIDGVRERYDLLNALTHGEMKGPEALAKIQDDLRGIEATDEKIAKGDPTALESFGPEYNKGLAKLTPSILERIRQTDPTAHEAIMLPEHVSFLANSPLLKDYNDLVDVLETKNDPRFDEATKMRFVIQQLGKMGQWLNALGEKAGQIKAPAVNEQATQFEQERAAFEKEKQELHWTTKIAPPVDAHENAKFTELLAPYQKRLKLDQGAQDDLKAAFKAGMKKAGESDAAYQSQMKAYRAQKTPDPAAVSNYVKNAITRHSKAVMDSLINARYSRFLAAPPRVTQQAAKPPVKGAGPVPQNVEVRTVKPPMNEIDHRNTPIEWLPLKQYRLYSGKVVRVQAVQ